MCFQNINLLLFVELPQMINFHFFVKWSHPIETFEDDDDYQRAMSKWAGPDYKGR